MNKETRLVLENQLAILSILRHKNNNCDLCKDIIESQIDKTAEALNQKESNTEKNIKGALTK